MKAQLYISDNPRTGDESHHQGHYPSKQTSGWQRCGALPAMLPSSWQSAHALLSNAGRWCEPPESFKGLWRNGSGCEVPQWRGEAWIDNAELQWRQVPTMPEGSCCPKCEALSVYCTLWSRACTDGPCRKMMSCLFSNEKPREGCTWWTIVRKLIGNSWILHVSYAGPNI